MRNFGGHLKLEAFANIGSSLGPDLLEEIAELRKAGDYSQEAMEKCRVGEIFKAHTGMNVVFYVSYRLGYNALAKFINLDNNHPFFKSRGLETWFMGETAISNLDKNPLEGAVDRKNYKVSGFFTELEAPIVVGLPMIKDKQLSNENLVGIIMHEAGHHFTYFEYLGNFVRESWLISNASRIAISGEAPEVKQKVLVRTQEQLGTEPLNVASLLQTANQTRKDTVELVLVSNSLIKGTNQSGTNLYDARTVEQLADAFVAYNGYGRHLAEALVRISKQHGSISARNPVVYLVAELLKTAFTLVMFFSLPVSTIIWLVAMVPGAKIYDDPEARINTLKQQLNAALRQATDPEEKDMLLADIKATDLAMKELKDKRTFYTMIYEAITPIGRKRLNQEKQQEAIKTILFNDFQAKALEMRK